jgi:hypothetical protein
MVVGELDGGAHVGSLTCTCMLMQALQRPDAKWYSFYIGWSSSSIP